MRVFFLLLLSIFVLGAKAESLADSYQLVLVKTADWSSAQGNLQRYERSSLNAAWVAVGSTIPVVLGKKGMTRDKKEGDQRTPIGLYRIGPVFGFAPQSAMKGLAMDYFLLTSSSACVDDPNSPHYNQLLDSSKPDWQSAEAMRQIDLYQWGAVIQYNQPERRPTKGSCIFLHRFRAENLGTAGCVAMDPQHLQQLLFWFEAPKKPMIALLPEPLAKAFKKKWDLH